nr:hypothetical protein [Methylobacterium sp. ZNC0032]
MSNQKPKISGPISAIGYSSVKVADLIAAPNGETRAVPIEGADICPVMNRVADRVGRVSFDQSTGVTTVTPGSAPRLEDLVDTIEQRHVEDLIADGCLVEPDEITVIGADPVPGTDQWFSLTVVEKLRKAKRMLGDMSEPQRQGLGLLFEAAALHGRYEVVDHEGRLVRALVADADWREGRLTANNRRKRTNQPEYRRAMAVAGEIKAAGGKDAKSARSIARALQKLSPEFQKLSFTGLRDDIGEKFFS